MSAHMPLPGVTSPHPSSPGTVAVSPSAASYGAAAAAGSSTNGLTPQWVTQTQTTLATLIRFPPLKPKLLERPPFAYVHDILSAVHKRSLLFDNAAQTGIEERLWNIHSLQAKSNRLLFVEKVVTFLSSKLGSPLNVDARDVVECRNCEQTCEMLRHAATLGLSCLRGDRSDSAASSHATPQKQQQRAQWPPVQTPQPSAFGLQQQRDLSPNAANGNGIHSSLPNQASSGDDEEKESKQAAVKQSGFTPLGRLEPMDKQHIRPVNFNSSSPISSHEAQLRKQNNTSPRTQPAKKNYDLMMSSSDEEEKQVKPNGNPVSPTKSKITTHLPPPINTNARIQSNPPSTFTPKTPDSQEVPPLTLLESKQLFAMFIPITSLTPERLANPSFDFIHELLVNVCEKTGFLDQVLTPDQMILDKLITDPPAQRLLLANVIRYVGLAVNHKCGVTPFTLLDGLHAYDSHIFLQNVARACLDPGLHMPTLLRRFEDGEDPLEETALDQIRENVAAQLAKSMSPANAAKSPKQQQQRTPTYIVSTLSALRTLADDSESNVSEKSLRLVTFDTLHHIVQLIIEKTGFLTGLFSYESSHLSYFRNMSSARETYAEEKLYLEKLIAFMHLTLPPPGVEITSDEIMNASSGRMDEASAEQNGYARAVNTFIQQVVYTAVDPDVDLGLLLKRYSDKYPSSSPLARHAVGQRRAPGQQQPVGSAVIAAAHTHASSIDDGMDVFAASQPWDNQSQGSLAASRLTNKRADDPEFAAVKRGAAPPLQSLVRDAEEAENENDRATGPSSSAAGFAQGGEGWIMNPNSHARVNPAAAAQQPNADAQWAVLSPRAAEMAKQEAQLIKQAHENEGVATGGKKLNKGLAPLPAESPDSAASSSSLPKKHLDSLAASEEALHKGAGADSLFDADPISANVRAALAVHKTPFTARPLILAKNYTYQYAASFTLGLAMILTVIFWRIFPPPRA